MLITVGSGHVDGTRQQLLPHLHALQSNPTQGFRFKAVWLQGVD